MLRMRVSGEIEAPKARVGVAGPPGIDRDVVIACLQNVGYQAFTVRASELQPEDCRALVLIEPRERDWELARDCDLPVVLLCDTRLKDGERAALVLRGADALVSIDASLDDLVDAVRTVLSGGSVFDPFVARAVARTVRRSEDRDQHTAFTQGRPRSSKRSCAGSRSRRRRGS